MSRSAAQPFWLDTAAGALFAWHHAPAEGVREAAVVLCRPFGYDAQCSQRAYRHLAERLCEAGFHVLRLDYHGTGDSSGEDGDGDRVATWVGSVRAGVEWLRSTVGVKKVVLFGSRFGALIAQQAAKPGDIDSLVLLAPPKSGRAWLREARALQALVGAGGAEKKLHPPKDGREGCGISLDGEHGRSCCKLDSQALPPGVASALVIIRDDLPGGEEALFAKLQASGVDATLSRAPGYGAMMQHDPHRSIVPDAAWSEVAAWLTARYPTNIQASPERLAYERVARVRGSRRLLSCARKRWTWAASSEF